MDINVLYYGDNLDILRKYIPDNSIDLIYLDPPFNSKATYNILYKELTGEPSKAQVMTFEDTWQWGEEPEKALSEIATSMITPTATKELISVLSNFVGQKTPMRAYLTMMCIRLIELKRVLKDMGSIYLHCDPTASHYLKIMLDTVYGTENFRNEIIWQRTGAHNDPKQWGRVADTILFYSKLDKWTWNPQFVEYTEDYIKERYKYEDEKTGRLYWRNTMTAAGAGKPKYFRGKLLNSPKGTHWRFSQEEINRMEKEGRIYYSPSGKPYVKSFLDEQSGRQIQSIWTDIVMSKSGKERIGYQTQKPEALLERIIKASSNEGDIVLDPFCGCGTALVAAQKLNRKWIGIDITHLSIGTMKYRLDKVFPGIKYKVVGEPVDLASAAALAKQDKYQFQWWATSLIKHAQPYGDKKKGADTGIDGFLFFQDEKDKIKKAIISVKGGHVGVNQIRDLIGVVKREKAEMGIFISLEPITKPMEQEAIMEGFYNSPLGEKYKKIQIFTIEELLGGGKPNIPSSVSPIATPKTHKKKEGKQLKLG